MAKHRISRRKVLKLTSTATLASAAGCLGGGNGGNGGDFSKEASKLNLGKNWKQRRIGGAKNWPMEARKKVPPRKEKTWTNSQSFKSAVENEVWKPPSGWKETAAGDVDSIQILNHGAVNMEFDPATLAAHELFEEVTGIKINPVEIGVDKANQKEQQVLSSKKAVRTR